MALKPQDKRVFPRVRFGNPIRYQVRGEAKFDNAVCDNVSIGGIGFTSNTFIPRATPLMLEFNVLSRIICPIGYVSWASPIPHSDRYKLGIEFKEFDPKEKEYLSDFVDLQQSV